MAQFTLEWNNTNVANNDNAIGQRASYRHKGDVSWITAGFDPANDLDTDATTTDSPDTLDDNKIYEFKVEALCTVSGPTINDNGIQEDINFACIDPDLDQDEEEATITIDVTGLDINKAKITLRKASDNSIVGVETTISAVSDTIARTVTGLLPSTNYYWQIALGAIVNSVQVWSSNTEYLSTVCSPYPFTTDTPPTCDPVTEVDVTSIEIP